MAGRHRQRRVILLTGKDGRLPVRQGRTHPVKEQSVMKIIVAIAASLLIFSDASAETGFLDRSVTFQGESYSYQVYVPANYTLESIWRSLPIYTATGDRETMGYSPPAAGWPI
jgi:hypothetical protein